MVDLKFFSETGFIWMRRAVDDADLLDLKRHMPPTEHPGARIAKSNDLFQKLEKLPFVLRIAELWPGMRPVRLVSFNKTPSANWGVSWHQDRIIAVNARADLEGYGQWSRKDGVWHCVPPLKILQNMLFVRVHIDQSSEENGAMQICPGSHRRGLVRKSQTADVVAAHEIETTLADPGDVLVLNMLVLHRSQPARVPSQRAALRIDFSADQLPPPLDWAH